MNNYQNRLYGLRENIEQLLEEKDLYHDEVSIEAELRHNGDENLIEYELNTLDWYEEEIGDPISATGSYVFYNEEDHKHLRECTEEMLEEIFVPENTEVFKKF